MENEEKIEEKKKVGRPKKEETMEEIKEVTVKCMSPCGWIISDNELGKRRINVNESVSFNIYDGIQLHNLIQVIRIINNPRINEVEYKDRGSGRHAIRKKFEIVSGLEYLPKVLQVTKMSKMEYTPEEREAITSLVPDFPPFKKKEKTVIIVK